MIIMKFGGTSVSDAPAMQNVVSIIKQYLDRKPVVVVSAMSGITNLLEKSVQVAAKQDSKKIQVIVQEIEEKHIQVVERLFKQAECFNQLKQAVHVELEKLRVLLDATKTIRIESEDLSHAVLSIGELLSSLLLSAILNCNGVKASMVDAREIMITTNFKKEIVPVSERIAEEAKKQILPLTTAGKVVVTQGFIGATSEGVPTTLGRNGSDFSASLLGAALQVDEIQIWTDVDGILTADPTIIPSAKLLDTMTFNEASELAYFGARVIYPAAIQPALEKDIPVRVLNSTNPKSKGTIILNKMPEKEKRLIKSIAYKENITLITIRSSQLLLNTKLMGLIFQRLAELNMRVYAVSKSAIKLTLTVESNGDFSDLFKGIPHVDNVKIEKNKIIVSVVGENMKGNQDISWQIIQLVNRAGIQIDLISQFASQVSFMFIINEADINETIYLLHDFSQKEAGL